MSISSIKELKELIALTKTLREEDSKFLDKYSEHIDTLKQAIALANSHKNPSWFNKHKWLIQWVIGFIVILVLVFIAPATMRANDICQINVKFGDNIGIERCH